MDCSDYDETKYNTILSPFIHQVGGHKQLMLLDKLTLCKPLIQQELLFYLNIPRQLENFVPLYKGVAEVKNIEGYPIIYHPIKGPEGANHNFVKALELQDESSQLLPKLKVLMSSCNHEQLLAKLSDSDLKSNNKSSPIYLLLMENIISHFEMPCILDLKMGTRTHGEGATEEKKHRQIAKCAASTSSTLGIRLCGMQIYKADSHTYIWKDKYYGRSLSLNGLKECIKSFFSNGNSLRIYVIDSVILKLKSFRSAIQQQSSFRFYSTSLLITYEGAENRPCGRIDCAEMIAFPKCDFDDDDEDDSKYSQDSSIDENQKRNQQSLVNKRRNSCDDEESSDSLCREDDKIDLRMIDFAHTVICESSKGPDKGFLFGLDNLIEMLTNIRLAEIQK